MDGIISSHGVLETEKVVRGIGAITTTDSGTIFRYIITGTGSTRGPEFESCSHDRRGVTSCSGICDRDQSHAEQGNEEEFMYLHIIVIFSSLFFPFLIDSFHRTNDF